jgi:hypothetical protein
MKKYTIAAFSLLVAMTALARIFGPFTGWNDLIDRSPDIVIARCTSTLDLSKPSFVVIQDDWIPSEIEVLSVLKGKTKPGPAHLMSTYWPHPGEQFLLFGNYSEHPGFTNYSVNEDYRVIPLGHYFQTNMIPGTNLQGIVRWAQQRRLDDLNQELEKGQAEKKRLEEGLKTLK